jgi:hypothetical protein
MSTNFLLHNGIGRRYARKRMAFLNFNKEQGELRNLAHRQHIYGSPVMTLMCRLFHLGRGARAAGMKMGLSMLSASFRKVRVYLNCLNRTVRVITRQMNMKEGTIHQPQKKGQDALQCGGDAQHTGHLIPRPRPNGYSD